MEVLGWILVALLLCLVLAVLTFLRQSQAVGGEERRRPQEVARGPGGRRQAGRMRRQVDREDSDQEEERDEDREELEEAGIKVPEGKIGKKKMEKLQAKADKKLQREAEQKEREENKKKREKLEEEERQKREMEKEEERRQEEEERKLREEKERREQEEYEKLKAAFSVEDEGCDAEDEEDEENRLLKFINYIKETKVVLLEDLAAQFKLKAQEAIDRVTQLQEDGLLTGVIDDRGKFIYISMEEMEAVAKFIKQQGRSNMYSLALSRSVLRMASTRSMATIKPIAASECLHEKEFWAKNKRLNRPLSPHLTIYKPQLTSMLSISHRISGVMQSGFLSLAALGVLVMPGNFPSALAELQSLQLGGAVIFSLKFLLSLPVSFHFFNGFRHLAWDLGHGFKINELYKSGWFVVGLALLGALGMACL